MARTRYADTVQERLPARFWSKVERRGADQCWPWLGSVDAGGYGQFSVSRKGIPAHRISYELLVCPIPEGMHIDHLCRNRICVNPAHLEAVTPGENTRRGLKGVLVTECAKGHPYTPENTRHNANGTRHCATCRLEKVRVWDATQISCEVCDKPISRRHMRRHLREVHNLADYPSRDDVADAASDSLRDRLRDAWGGEGA